MASATPSDDKIVSVSLTINGRTVAVPADCTVAGAVLRQQLVFRRSVTGEPRAPLCGMGICFECRAVVDGVPHARTCQVLCREGMVVTTDD